MGDVGRLVGSSVVRNGEEGWRQNFREIFEGLLEILQGCEDGGDLMRGGVWTFVLTFFLCNSLLLSI